MILPDLQVTQRVLFTVYTAMAWAQQRQQSPSPVDVPSLLYALVKEYAALTDCTCWPCLRLAPISLTRGHQLQMDFSAVRGQIAGPTDEDLERARTWVACHIWNLPNYPAHVDGDLSVGWPALWWLVLCTTSFYRRLYSPPSERFMRELAAVVAGHTRDIQHWQPAKPFRRILQ